MVTNRKSTNRCELWHVGGLLLCYYSETQLCFDRLNVSHGFNYIVLLCGRPTGELRAENSIIGTVKWRLVEIASLVNTL